jgi:hypothetical protein
MRIGAAIFVTALGLTSACPADARDDLSAVGLLQRACFDTGLNANSLERMARAGRWRSTSSTPDFRRPAWAFAYRVGAHTVMLARIATAGDVTENGIGTVCTVNTERPPARWRSDIEALAASHDLDDSSTAEVPPGFAPIQVWSGQNGYTLSAAYRASPAAQSMSLSRQVVTESQEPSPAEER